MKRILIALMIVIALAGLTAIVFGFKTAGYWIYKGGEYNQARDYVNADKAFDRALKLSPKSIVAWNCKGGNCQFQSRHAEALDAFDHALAIEARNQTDEVEQDFALVMKSESLIKLKQYEDAISVCNEYLRRLRPNEDYKNRGIIKLNMAFAYGRLGRYQLALETYNDKDTAVGIRRYYERACIYSLMGDKEYALADLSSAVNQNSGYYDYDFNYFEGARYHRDNKRYHDNNRSYKWKDMSRTDKDFEWLWNDPAFIGITAKTRHEWAELGYQLSDEGKYPEAIKAFDQAIVMGENDYQISEAEGTAYIKMGKYDDAIRVSRHNTYDHDNFGLLYNTARAYSLKNDKNKALNNLRKAIVLQPGAKASTRKDPDFQWLWGDAEFRRITR